VDNTRERWDALDKSDQERILDKHRDINVDYDWWDDVYADFVMDMQAIGIQVDTRTVRTHKGRTYEEPNISFSGFWSQGDGAAFAGRMYYADIAARMEKKPEMKEMQARYTADLDCHMGWHVRSNNSMSFDYGYDLPEPDDDAPALRQIAQRQVRDEFDKVMEVFMKELEEEVKGHANQLYKNLEKEYEYQTSDEAVLETLFANDMIEEELNELESA